MAKKEFSLNQGKDKLQEYLDHPAWKVYDKYAKVYRFYRTEAKRDEAAAILVNSSLPADFIVAQEYELPAPAPYSVSIKNYTDGVSVLDGAEGTYVDFEFQTVDGNGTPLNEWVDVSYTFTNNGVSQQAAGSYAGGTHVRFLADKFLRPGSNSITLIATGRTSGVTSSPVVLTYNVVSIGISSTFDVAKAQDRDSVTGLVSMLITYKTWGAYDKYVEFYVDGSIVNSATAFVSASNDMSEGTSVARIADIAQSLSPGIHNLQIRTRVTLNGSNFYTKTLFFEFNVTGQEQTTVMISQVLSPGTIINAATPLILNAVQFKPFVLDWGYYTSKVSGHTATVKWQLNQNGETTVISTQNATVIDATNNVSPDPLNISFETYGEYDLEAVINNNVVRAYRILISKDTNNIEEYRNGLRLKLSARGRSNAEPNDIRDVWNYGNYGTSFNGFLWNSVNGWQNSALVLKEGATADININPLVSPQGTGATVEITFETFSVSDENVAIVKCDNGTGGGFTIYGKKALMHSRLGASVDTEFPANKKVTLSFVINPSSTSGITSEPNLMFIQTNGIRERSKNYAGANDTFNSADTLHLGDSTGKAGVKIYSILVYDRAIDRNSSANNYILGSDNVSELVNVNDILTNGHIDVDKLTSKYDTIAISGADLSKFFNSTSKDKLYGNAWRKNPQNPNVNFEAVGAVISHPGQSTLGFSKPQLRIDLNSKKAVVLYDYQGNISKKGRYSIIEGNIPEKKMRLNPNFVDSTCGNAGGFFSMVNDIYPKTQIGSQSVLMNDAQLYARDQYKTATGKDFPYPIQNVPAATPIVVIWRPTESDEWSFLSVFTLLDEKRSPYKFGQHSIYDKILDDGSADPFDFEDGVKGNRLFDNKDCLEYEFQDNGEDLALFRDITHFWDGNVIDEAVIERTYPDADDCTDEELHAADLKFYSLAQWFYSCRNNQSKFNSEWKQYLDPYKWAAYYVLMLKLGMTDSVVRNLHLRTDNGTIWFPTWWDADVMKGKRNDGPLVYKPRINRQSKDPNNADNYAFAGHDAVYWNLLEGCDEFVNTYVPQVNQAMYNAGLTAENMMKYFQRFTNYYCIRLYNESIQEKYISDFPDKDYLAFNMGNGENHDLWWVADSFQYWDAVWASGSYASKSVYVRCNGAFGKYSDEGQALGRGLRMYVKSAVEQFYTWAQTSIEYKQLSSPIHAEAGDTFNFEIGVEQNKLQKLGYNNPIVIFGTQSAEELDLHELARYFSSTIQLYGLYDENLGSNVKKLILGVSKEDMAQGIFNTEQIAFAGLSDLDILEYLDIQGQKGFTSFADGSFDQLKAIKTFKAAGSGLASFTPAEGIDFTLIELPDSIRSIQMTECTWQSVKFFKPDGNTQYASVPDSLEGVYFYNMGTDVKVKNFVFDWLKAIRDNGDNDFSYRHLSVSSLVWTTTADDLLLLARIPAAQRLLSGTVIITDDLTPEQYEAILNAFGSDCFTHGARLVISAGSQFVIGGASNILAGEQGVVTGVSFPITEGTPNVEFEIVGCAASYDDDGNKIYVYRSATLYAKSGVIKTVENSTPSFEMTVRGVNLDTYAYASMTVRVNARTYPTSASVSGQQSITETGIFDYTSSLAPSGTTGTRTSYEWLLSNVEGIARYSADANRLRVQVNELIDEATFEVVYKAMFANGQTVTSTALRAVISAVQVIMRAIDSESAQIVIKAIYDAYCEDNPDWQLNRNVLTNINARRLLSLPTSLTGNEALKTFPELRLFKALVSIDLSNTGLNEDYDLSNLSRLQSVNFSGTPCNVKLDISPVRSLHLGSPTKIYLKDCPNLTMANIAAEWDGTVPTETEVNE